jgi:predicted nucleotidyltransferase
MRAMNALPAVLEENMEAIRALCQKYRVKRLAVFGSAATGTFDPKRSDVDFVVEFFPMSGIEVWDAYFDLKFALRDLLGHSVDLVQPTAVRNPYFLQNLEETQRNIYAAA